MNVIGQKVEEEPQFRLGSPFGVQSGVLQMFHLCSNQTSSSCKRKLPVAMQFSHFPQQPHPDCACMWILLHTLHKAQMCKLKIKRARKIV